jgi:hypothetical protein
MAWPWKIKRDEIAETVTRAVNEIMTEYLKTAQDELSAVVQIRGLRREITDLEKKLADLKEKQTREEREIEHKIGLHRLRQEEEERLAKERLAAREKQLKEEAKVLAREGKVEAREEAMKRADELLGEQVARMERLVETLVKMLPSAEIYTEVSKK